MGHLLVNKEFDTALGPCQNHYSPVHEEGATKRGGSKIPGAAIICPARVYMGRSNSLSAPPPFIYFLPYKYQIFLKDQLYFIRMFLLHPIPLAHRYYWPLGSVDAALGL